jgi:DNA polymerase II large subunit
VLEYFSNEAIEEVEKVKQYDCPIEVLFVSGNRIDEITCQEKNAFVFQLMNITQIFFMLIRGQYL